MAPMWFTSRSKEGRHTETRSISIALVDLGPNRMANVLIVSSASDAKGFDPWKHGTTFMLLANADVDSF